MADSKPINWAYPFPNTGTAINPLQYLTNMAKANGGYYPTGENGLWHGGVHFDKGTAAVFDQSSVRCIADGEVIAYRVNDSYPISEYRDDIPQIKRGPFSSGFVLVKHRLQPPRPSNAGAAASEQSPPTLTFYSLYMHLQDWAAYQAKPSLPRPTFWEAATYSVDTKDQGLNVRAEPKTNGEKLAVLSKGAQVTVSHSEGDFCKLLSIVSGAAEPALTPDSEGKLPGFVAFKLLKAQHEPKAKDSVVVLDTGIAIKAGDLIGHLGTYQNHNGAAQPLLHLEVFSCEDVPGFISKSQAWARPLPDAEKTLLKVHKDASKLIAHRDDIKPDNPPKQGDAGNRIGVDLIIPQALLDGLPTTHKIKVSTTPPGSSTAQTTHWWRLDGLFADKDGNPINGWLAEQDLITTRHSPWEWPGFQCIEDTGAPVEKLAYALNARGMLSDDEKQNYRAQISKADGGPVLAIARLFDIVDSDKDGVLTSDEIRAALGKPWHAQVLGQLVTKYESEWYWNKSKWDELDPLLAEEPGKPNPIWEIEKQRIEKLSWWKELAGQHGISEDGKAWHFQPIGLAGNFSGLDDENDLKWLKVPRGQLTFDVEGNDIDNPSNSLYRYFSRIIHWPGGASGVTIGRGYDLGQRPNPETDLSSARISEPLFSWLIGAKGLKGQAAKDYLASASTEIKSTRITRKQQYDLFIPVYEFMKNEVIRISSSNSNIEEYGRLNWDATDSKIQDMAVDLIYRGDYTPNSRKIVQQHIVDNNIEELQKVMSDRTRWPSVPDDRFSKRSEYLRKTK
ncbi:pesticin C-terminus-like muramidase [Pseudomonas benzenivorans]|uniref:pesticin C-terminus-like muramidase n=1 Tax=Pseudomonas benzenivorans TaxID=556533 RepID=UPI003516C0F2